MVNIQAKVPRNVNGYLIEQLNAIKHAQTDKGWPINKQKREKRLFCKNVAYCERSGYWANLSTKMCSTSQRQVNKQANVYTNVQRVVFEQPKVQKHAHQMVNKPGIEQKYAKGLLID